MICGAICHGEPPCVFDAGHPGMHSWQTGDAKPIPPHPIEVLGVVLELAQRVVAPSAMVSVCGETTHDAQDEPEEAFAAYVLLADSTGKALHIERRADGISLLEAVTALGRLLRVELADRADEDAATMARSEFFR